jgi:hypothetical protein
MALHLSNTISSRAVRLLNGRALRLATLAMLGCFALACGNEPPSAPGTLARDPIWRVVMAPHGGLTIALGDSVQLGVTALDLDQQPVTLDTATAVVYSTTDPSYVSVSPSGMLRGLTATNPFSPIRVVATVKGSSVNSADTVLVAVTPTRQVVDSITVTADSLRTAVLGPGFVTPMAWGGGVPLPNVYVYVTTDGSHGATIDPIYAYVLGFSPGTIWIRASTTAYGTTLTDSVQYTLLNLSSGAIALSDAPSGGITATGLLGSLDGAESYFQPCATVTWTNSSAQALDITFDVPANTGQCGTGDTTPTGNITNLAPGSSVSRKFVGEHKTQWSVVHSASPSKTLLTSSIVTR